jgi:hypothetical protein
MKLFIFIGTLMMRSLGSSPHLNVQWSCPGLVDILIRKLLQLRYISADKAILRQSAKASFPNIHLWIVDPRLGPQH